MSSKLNEYQFLLGNASPYSMTSSCTTVVSFTAPERITKCGDTVLLTPLYSMRAWGSGMNEGSHCMHCAVGANMLPIPAKIHRQKAPAFTDSAFRVEGNIRSLEDYTH